MSMGDFWWVEVFVWGGGGGGARVNILRCKRVEGLPLHFCVFCGLHCGRFIDFIWQIKK